MHARARMGADARARHRAAAGCSRSCRRATTSSIARRRRVAGRARRGHLDLRHLRAAPRRLDASRLQRGLAARLRHAGGAPVRRACASSLFFAVTAAGGALAHLAVHAGDARADGRRVGGDLRHHGGRDALCVPARRPAAPARQRSGRRLPRAGAAAARGAARSARADFLGVWFGLNCCSASARSSLDGGEQAIAWQAHIGGFLAGLLCFALFDPVQPARFGDSGGPDQTATIH